MADRESYLVAFIKKHHLKDVTWLSQDASTRRYARVNKKGKTYILMDSPLSEKPKEFVKINKYLRHNHFCAPRIYAKNLRHGFLLLEDFGSCHLSHAVQDKKRADELYILALDTLIKIQKEAQNITKFPLGYKQMRLEHNLFLEYYVPLILKKKLSSTAKNEFHKIWDKLFKGMEKLPKTLMLYDYHLDNLMLRKDGKLGLLDFQDAMVGPIFYDVISLVEDERFPLPGSKRQKLLQHYFELRPVLADPKYVNWLSVVAAHRHVRVMGIFARLATVHQKPHYLKYIKNDLRFLKENLQSPLLKDFAQWIKKYLKSQFWDTCV